VLADDVLNYCSVIKSAQPGDPVGHVMNVDQHVLMKIHENTGLINSVHLMTDLIHVLGNLL
jgi:hypothetical protein